MRTSYPSTTRVDLYLTFVALLTLSICVLISYSPILHFGFVWDDHQLIERQVIAPKLSGKMIDMAGCFLQEKDSPFHTTLYYRPLSCTAHYVVQAIWGPKPGYFHLLSLLLQIHNSCMIFLLAVTLLKNSWPALLSALLYAFHPILIESVAWISAQADLMLTACVLQATYFYIRHLLKKGTLNLLPTFLFILLAALSKESGLLTPLLLFVFGTLTSQRPSKRNLNISLLLAFLFCLVFYLMGKQAYFLDLASQNAALPFQSFFQRIWSFPFALAHYAKLTLFPSVLSVFRGLDYSKGFSVIALGYGCLFGFVLVCKLKLPFFVTTFLLLFTLALLPALQPVLPNGVTNQIFVISDRYLTLPLAYVALGLAFSLDRLKRRFFADKQASFVLSILLLSCPLFYHATTKISQHLPLWQSDMDLFSYEHQLDPQSIDAAYALSLSLTGKKRYRSAINVVRPFRRQKRYPKHGHAYLSYLHLKAGSWGRANFHLRNIPSSSSSRHIRKKRKLIKMMRRRKYSHRKPLRKKHRFILEEVSQTSLRP